jgi:hypothetical protein
MTMIGRIVFAFAMAMCSFNCTAQLVVDGKNINDDKSIEYIQMTYYADQKTFLPVFLIDYGIKDFKDVNLKPAIQVNGEVLKAVSPVAVLNKLHEAGWEYLGDHINTQSPQISMHTYTLKRKH